MMFADCISCRHGSAAVKPSSSSCTCETRAGHEWRYGVLFVLLLTCSCFSQNGESLTAFLTDQQLPVALIPVGISAGMADWHRNGSLEERCLDNVGPSAQPVAPSIPGKSEWVSCRAAGCQRKPALRTGLIDEAPGTVQPGQEAAVLSLVGTACLDQAVYADGVLSPIVDFSQVTSRSFGDCQCLAKSYDFACRSCFSSMRLAPWTDGRFTSRSNIAQRQPKRRACRWRRLWSLAQSPKHHAAERQEGNGKFRANLSPDGPEPQSFFRDRVTLRLAGVARRSFTGTAQLDPVTCENLCLLRRWPSVMWHGNSRHNSESKMHQRCFLPRHQEPRRRTLPCRISDYCF